MTKKEFIGQLHFDSNGLIPAIVQDIKSEEVLMLAYMNAESLEKTLDEGRTCYYSRSRKKLWTKGETSGCFQYVKEIHFDCDSDTLLIKVEQVGPACHKGYKSCFFRQVEPIYNSDGQCIANIVIKSKPRPSE